MRTLATLLIAGAVMILNPSAGCRGEPYAFGVEELRAALAGTWQLTIAGQAPVRYRIEQATAPRHGMRTKHHARPGLVRAADACGSRTLVASASACIDDTKMPLVLIAIDGSSPSLDGNLVVFGKQFREARLTIALSAKEEVVARIAPSGDVIAAEVLAAELARASDVAVSLVHER